MSWDGFLNMLKPPGMTSSDMVASVRRLLPRGTRVGHGGTLDPDAAGVLPVCVGRATRLFDYIIDKQKRYVAVLRLGVETDTQDASGTALAVKDASGVTADMVAAVLPRFVGEIDQVPPAYSAIKRGGVRMYALARAGEAPALEPRRVVVDAIRLIADEGDQAFLIEVSCRKGVYIRTLCHDIGRTLGVGGHMAALLRVSAGSFDIDQAVTIETLQGAAQAGTLERLMTKMDAPLGHYPALRAPVAARGRVLNGVPLELSACVCPEGLCPGAIVRVYVGDEFAGMGQADDQGVVRMRAVLLDRAEA